MPMGEAFETFARKLGEYIMQKFVIPYIREHGVVMSYRAQVISKNTTDKTMVVQRPFDDQITLPYGTSAAGLSAGDQCTVFSLGDPLNSVVVADGKMNL